VSALDATFAALADPTRRRVVELLRESPYRASDLAEACEASRPAMSRHLRVLRTAELIEEEQGGDDRDLRERTYRLKAAPFEELRGWLEELDQFWSAQLSSFAEHVANKEGKP